MGGPDLTISGPFHSMDPCCFHGDVIGHLPNTRACWMRIGDCTPTVCPIHDVRCASRAAHRSGQRTPP